MKTILLVGTDILPEIGSGDKNFWLELVQKIDQKRIKLVILSINNVSEKNSRYHTIKIYNTKPLFINDKKNTSKKVHKSYHKNYFQKSLTCIKIIPEINKIIKQEKIDAVHFIDNYGPMMFFFKLFIKKRMTVNAVTYNPTSFLYDFFLKMSFKGFDEIISYSESYQDLLNTWGFENVKTIHWGVDNKQPILKKQLGKKIVWTGFTQQTQIEDFLFSYELAKELVKKDKKIEFCFIFKPEHFKKEFEKYNLPRIVVRKSEGDYEKTVQKYDYFLCPVLNLKSTLAPPLSWLEALNWGLPLITNKRKGIDNIVKNRYNGLVFNKEKSTDQVLAFINSKNGTVIKNCHTVIEKNYNLTKIAKDYEKLWSAK